MTKRTANRSTGPTRPGTDASPEVGQEQLQEIYTAHQVHTLAQIMFQQLACGWNGATHASYPNATSGPAVGWNPTGQQGMGQPIWHNAHPPIVHWYP